MGGGPGGHSLPVPGAVLVALRGSALDAEARMHVAVSGGRDWAVGMGGADMLRPLSPARCAGLDASAPPPPPFPGRVQVTVAPAIFKAGYILQLVGLGCPLGPKLILLDDLGGVWMLGGGPGGGRRGVRGRNLCLGCRRATMASRGAWLRLLGRARVCRRGASAGVHHLPVFVLAGGGGGRGRRILHEGAMAVLLPLACDSG